MNTEMISLQKAATDNAKASEVLQSALQTLTDSTKTMQAAQATTKRSIETIHAEFTLSIKNRSIKDDAREAALDDRFENLIELFMQKQSPRKER